MLEFMGAPPGLAQPDSLENRDEQVIATLSKLVDGFFSRYHRAELLGLENIPEGAGLYVGNHNGGLLPMDAWLFGARLYRTQGMEHVPYGLAHDLVVSTPVVADVLVRLGALRATHENAARVFEAGKKVVVYPGGHRDAFRPFKLRHQVSFAGRKGYIRLALQAGVPIIPIVSAGSHSTFVVLRDFPSLGELLRVDALSRVPIFPLMFSLPFGLTVGLPVMQFPLPAKIRVEILEPIEFSRTGIEAAQDEAYVTACDTIVTQTMQAALDQLSQGLC